MKINPNIEEHISLIHKDIFYFMMQSFDMYYPGFETWYIYKVIPDLLKRQRILHTVQNGQIILGISILKLSSTPDQHNKISSFYIDPKIRGNGIGAQLMEVTLQSSRPLNKPIIITVPEERLWENIKGQQFLAFLEQYEFRIVAELLGRYREGKKEYILQRTLPKYQ